MYVWYELCMCETQIEMSFACGRCVTWLICMCNMTHLYSCDMNYASRRHLSRWVLPAAGMWHDSFLCVIWRTYIRAIWIMHVRDTFEMSFTYSRYVTWLICVCNMTHSYVQYEWFMRETPILDEHRYTYSRRASPAAGVWHDSFICVTWCIIMCNTHVIWNMHVRDTNWNEFRLQPMCGVNVRQKNFHMCDNTLKMNLA